VLDLLTGPELASLGTVIIVDIVMSGDNAIVIGMAAAGLPVELRRRAICVGIVAATVLRIMFASVTYHLLAIIGLTLAGGLLLLWVCWKMWREIRDGQITALGNDASNVSNTPALGYGNPGNPTKNRKTLRQALVAIVVADVSMSLDNVLAVAGAAHDYLWVLIFGLTLSIALMAVASNYIAKLLERHHWIAYIGLVIVAYVAVDMIYRGFIEVAEAAML
jgi:YjbE family integral membrane protein